MPEPLPDITRDHQCYHYQAPTGQRCGSPALKGEYYCYHHHLKNAKRTQSRVLIDPEVTCMDIPPIEDRASIFVALAAVVHRLAENTIDTRRAGQMIYGLQVAMRALEPAPANKARHPERSACAESKDPETAQAAPISNTIQPTTAPKTISITKESLLYFLRSRHCYHCNAELFPAEELTERRNPGAPPEPIEEAPPALRARLAAELRSQSKAAALQEFEALRLESSTHGTSDPQPSTAATSPDPSGTLPSVQAVASSPACFKPRLSRHNSGRSQQRRSFLLSADSGQAHSSRIKPLCRERPSKCDRSAFRTPLCFTLT